MAVVVALMNVKLCSVIYCMEQDLVSAFCCRSSLLNIIISWNGYILVTSKAPP